MSARVAGPLSVSIASTTQADAISGYFQGYVGIGTTTPAGMFHARAATSTSIVSILQGALLQSANLTEWRNSTGTILALVSATGTLAIPNLNVSSSATINNLTVLGTCTGCGAGTFTTTTINGLSTTTYLFSGANGLTIGTSSNGTITFTAPNPGGAGATTTINGSEGPAFTFASSTTGTDFSIGTSSNIITWYLPSAASGARGLLTANDWNTFSGKATISDIYGLGFVTATSTAFTTPAQVSSSLYIPGFITATSSEFYNKGFITSTSTAFTTPAQVSSSVYGQAFITATSSAFYNQGFITATSSEFYAKGFITATSTAFTTPTQVSSSVYGQGFITSTSTAFTTPAQVSSSVYGQGFITATSSEFYAKGFITATSTAFTTPAQVSSSIYGQAFITATSSAFYNQGFITATSSEFYAKGFITATSTAFTTPAQVSSSLYIPGFITATGSTNFATPYASTTALWFLNATSSGSTSTQNNSLTVYGMTSSTALSFSNATGTYVSSSFAFHNGVVTSTGLMFQNATTTGSTSTQNNSLTVYGLTSSTALSFSNATGTALALNSLVSSTNAWHQNATTTNLYINGLTSSACIGTDGYGKVITATCGGGVFTTTTINGLSTTTYVFSGAGGLTIGTSSDGTVTFTQGAGVAGAGGNNTEIQFNNAGVLTGDASFTWTSSTDELKVTASSTFNGTTTFGRVKLSSPVSEASISTGGLFNLQRTGTGAGMILNSGSAIGQNATGRLLGLNCNNNDGLVQDCMHIDYSGSGDALSITMYSSSSPSNAISILSNSSNAGPMITETINVSTSASNNVALWNGTSYASTTPFNLTSYVTRQGAIKIIVVSSTMGAQEDNANSSAISIDLQGVGTKSQGIFIDSTAASGTSGSLLNIRNAGQQKLLLDAGGNLMVTSSLAVATTTIAGNGALTVRGTSTFYAGGASSSAMQVLASIAPTQDMMVISNAGFPVVAAGASAIQVNYVGGAGAIESSASRVDFVPGTGAGSVWNAYRILGSSTLAGVQENAIKIEAMVSSGLGFSRGLFIGGGWTKGININVSSTATTGASGLEITASSSPLTDMVAISNNGSSRVNSSGTNALDIDFYGGVGTATESGAVRLDIIPGTSASSTWSALRIVGTSTPTGATELGIRIDPIGTGGGMERAIWIGGGWKSALVTDLPYANATSALVMLGSSTGIIGGSTGGTFIGANQTATTSDFINFQVRNRTVFKVNASGTTIIGTTSTFQASTTMLLVCAPRNCTLGTGTSTYTAVAVFGSTNGTQTGISIAARGKVAAGAPDIGEYINVVGPEENYEAGDLISISTSTTSPPSFEKSSKAYDSNLAGVITETAGLVAGAGDDYRGSKIITLAGRVPVKVNNQNGPVAAGDYLTSSDVPGYAMRALRSGRIIGQAMTDFTAATSTAGTVIGFIHPGFYPGPAIESLFRIQPGENAGAEILAKFIDQNRHANPTAITSEILTDRLAAGLEIISPSVIAHGLTVDSISAVDALITFKSDTVFFGRPYFNTDTAGFAIVSKNSQSVDIVFEKEYIDQPIVTANISLEGSETANIENAIFGNNISYIITNKSVNGFTIKLNHPAPEDIRFGWVAVAVRGAKTFTSVVPDSGAPAVPSVTAGDSSSSVSSTPLGISSSTEPTAPDASSTPPVDISPPAPETTPPAPDPAVTPPDPEPVPEPPAPAPDPGIPPPPEAP